MTIKEVSTISKAARGLLEALEKSKEHEALAAELRLLIEWTEREYFKLLKTEEDYVETIH